MKTLVLDKQYQPIRFISLRKLAIFILKDKVEVISCWDNAYFINDYYPSIVRLREYVRKKPTVPTFNRKALFKRDQYICQYTGKKLPASKLTVDHVIPKARGGKNSWDNCVTASLDINSLKGDKTPEEAGLKLISKPKPPASPLFLEYLGIKKRHPDWGMYFAFVDKANQ